MKIFDLTSISYEECNVIGSKRGASCIYMHAGIITCRGVRIIHGKSMGGGKVWVGEAGFIYVYYLTICCPLSQFSTIGGILRAERNFSLSFDFLGGTS